MSHGTSRLQNCSDGPKQNFIAERFSEECEGACLQCLGADFSCVPSRHKDDRRCATGLNKLPLQFKATHPRQSNIKDKTVRITREVCLEKFLRGRKAVCLNPHRFYET